MSKKADRVLIEGRAGILAHTSDCEFPVANADAVITKAAPGAGKHNTISAVYWSYDGTPTGGALHIDSGNSAHRIFSIDITAGGPGFMHFDPPRKINAATALIVTLVAGGAGVTGKLNISHWVE
jgi:hypothetical protein